MVVNNKAAANLCLVLILMKLALLAVLTSANHMVVYTKIFNNEQFLYDQQLKLHAQLIATANTVMQTLPPIGFVADDFSLVNQDQTLYGVKSGIDIYKINIDNRLYAYWGVRSNVILNFDFIQEQLRYYIILLKDKHIMAHKITAVSFFNNHTIDQLFFFDDLDKLWRYDVVKDQLFLQGINPNNINYIVGSIITDYATNLEYVIYLLCRENNQYVIKLTTLEKNNIIQSHTILTLPSSDIASNFFLRANNLIVLYQNIEPQIYQVEYKNKLLITKIDIKYKVSQETLNNVQQDLQAHNGELVWDPKLNVHQATIIDHNDQLKIYQFNLPTDNGIVSFRASDY